VSGRARVLAVSSLQLLRDAHRLPMIVRLGDEAIQHSLLAAEGRGVFPEDERAGPRRVEAEQDGVDHGGEATAREGAGDGGM